MYCTLRPADSRVSSPIAMEPPPASEASKCIKEPLERVALDMDADKAAVQDVEARAKSIVTIIMSETATALDELRKLDSELVTVSIHVHSSSISSCCFVNIGSFTRHDTFLQLVLIV